MGPSRSMTVGVEEALVYEEASEEGTNISFFGQLSHALPTLLLGWVRSCPLVISGGSSGYTDYRARRSALGPQQCSVVRQYFRASFSAHPN